MEPVAETPHLSPMISEDFDRILKKHGINHFLQVIEEDPEMLAKRTHIPYKEVLTARNRLLEKHGSASFTGRTMCEEATANIAILSTGNLELDSLLDGGVYTGELTEFFGGPGSGKTQLCLSVAIALLKNTEQQVVWIDTGASLDAGRLQEVLQALGLDPVALHKACKRIKYLTAFDLHELIKSLHILKSDLRDPSFNVKLLVVDSIAAVPSPVLSLQSSDGVGLMMEVASLLHSIAKETGLAGILTNNMVSHDHNPQPSLGNSWSHVPNTRLYIQRSTLEFEKHPTTIHQHEIESIHKATLVKSCRQAIGKSAQFDILCKM